MRGRCGRQHGDAGGIFLLALAVDVQGVDACGGFVVGQGVEFLPQRGVGVDDGDAGLRRRAAGRREIVAEGGARAGELPSEDRLDGEQLRRRAVGLHAPEQGGKPGFVVRRCLVGEPVVDGMPLLLRINHETVAGRIRDKRRNASLHFRPFDSGGTGKLPLSTGNVCHLVQWQEVIHHFASEH